MIGDLVFDPELAEPSIGQIDLHLSSRAAAPSGAQTRSRRAASGSSAPDQSRAGQCASSNGASSLCTQLRSSNTIDLAHQMIRRHHLVEIKRIKELALTALPPPHHAPLPQMPVSTQRNHRSRVASTGVLQHNPPESGHEAKRDNPLPPSLPHAGTGHGRTVRRCSPTSAPTSSASSGSAAARTAGWRRWATTAWARCSWS